MASETIETVLQTQEDTIHWMMGTAEHLNKSHESLATGHVHCLFENSDVSAITGSSSQSMHDMSLQTPEDPDIMSVPTNANTAMVFMQEDTTSNEDRFVSELATDVSEITDAIIEIESISSGSSAGYDGGNSTYEEDRNEKDALINQLREQVAAKDEAIASLRLELEQIESEAQYKMEEIEVDLEDKLVGYEEEVLQMREQYEKSMAINMQLNERLAAQEARHEHQLVAIKHAVRNKQQEHKTYLIKLKSKIDKVELKHRGEVEDLKDMIRQLTAY